MFTAKGAMDAKEASSGSGDPVIGGSEIQKPLAADPTDECCKTKVKGLPLITLMN